MPATHQTDRSWRVLILSLVMLSASSPLRSQSPTMHVEVYVHPKSVNEGLLQTGFTARDLRLFAGDQKVHTQVRMGNASAEPRTLLIVTDVPNELCQRMADAHTLIQMVRQGWHVELASRTSWENPRAVPVSQDKSSACALVGLSSDGSLAQLVKSVGRRVVLFTQPVEGEMITSTHHLVPEVYVVDGGRKLVNTQPLLALHQTTPVSPGESSLSDGAATVPCHSLVSAASEFCQVGTTSVSRVDGYAHGAVHTRNLSDALNFLNRSGEEYFDFAFDGSTLKGPLQLQIRGHEGASIDVSAYRTTSFGSEPTRDVGLPVSVKSK